MTSNNDLKIGNELIEANYKLDLISSDILFFLISKIHKNDKDLKTQEISVKDLEATTGKKIKYSDIKEAGMILRTPFVFILERNLKTATPNFALPSFLTSFSFMNGIISVEFDPLIKPYLINLKNNFTQLGFLRELNSLRNVKTKRLYMLLKRNVYKRYYKFNKIEDLHTFLRTDSKKMKASYAYFNEKYLNKAIKDINENTSLSIDINTKKIGRKTVGITFLIKENKVETIKPKAQVDPEPQIFKEEKQDEPKVLETEIITNTEEINFTDLNNTQNGLLDRKVFNEGIEMINEMFPNHLRKKLDSKILDIYYKKAQNYEPDYYMEQIEDLILNWKYPTFPTPVQFLETSVKTGVKAGIDWLKNNESSNTFLNNVEDDQFLIS